MGPKVSIVIPCYNAEKTIARTLDSLMIQTCQDFCVLAVNDGSEDNTKEIIEKYSRQHPKMDIRLTNIKNSGVSKARNVALDQCETEYVAFLDADDLYHPIFLKTYIDQMENNFADICIGRYCWNEFEKLNEIKSVQSITSEQLLDMYFHKRINKLGFWGGIYRRNIIKENGLQFTENIKYGEDSEFFCKYLYHCKKAVFVDAKLYCYINESTSAMHRISYDKTQNIKAFERIIKYWGNKMPKGSEYIVARAVWSCLKDFAIDSKEYYRQLQEEYDVKNAMKLLIRTEMEREKTVKYTAMIYLANPMIFRIAVGSIGKLMWTVETILETLVRKKFP
ncbi:MAG: glycosyltransferase [Lachnospiraceae bacterium]|nr:glycosyltransferase [Lachnospiraceae bacterium]